eukprot:44312-Pelagomonas_calceolata.AAC.1
MPLTTESYYTTYYRVMPLTTPTISVAAEDDIRPDWHAFGMLVAWIGAGIVVLISYIWRIASKEEEMYATLDYAVRYTWFGKGCFAQG